jgi:hypothetical protein
VTRNWRRSTNRAAPAARIANIKAFVATGPTQLQSPIDLFETAVGDLLRAADPTLLTGHPTIGPLMLVGIVSATENFFRDLFARVIELCPVAQRVSADEKIQLGTVLWHGGHLPQRGVFEHLSFSSPTNVRNACKNFIGYELKKNGAADVLLKEFDNVCELRHGIVHSGTVIAGKNALKLGIAAPAAHARVRVGYPELQEAADICASLALAFNAELFSAIVERWATQWRSLPSWRVSAANERFREIWRAFLSTVDDGKGLRAEPIGLRRCRNLVKKEYGIT